MTDTDSASTSEVVVIEDTLSTSTTADTQQKDSLSTDVELHVEPRDSPKANAVHRNSASPTVEAQQGDSPSPDVEAKHGDSSSADRSNANTFSRKRDRIELMKRIKQLQTLLEKIKKVNDEPENTHHSIEQFYTALENVKLYLWPQHDNSQIPSPENKMDNVFKYRLRLTLYKDEENPGCFVTTGHSLKSQIEAKNEAILAAIDNMLQPEVYQGLSSENNGANCELLKEKNNASIEEITIDDCDINVKEAGETQGNENNKTVLEKTATNDLIEVDKENQSTIDHERESDSSALKRDKFKELIDDKSDVQVVNSLRNLIKKCSNKVANDNDTPIVLGKLIRVVMEIYSLSVTIET